MLRLLVPLLSVLPRCWVSVRASGGLPSGSGMSQYWTRATAPAGGGRLSRCPSPAAAPSRCPHGPSSTPAASSSPSRCSGSCAALSLLLGLGLLEQVIQAHAQPGYCLLVHGARPCLRARLYSLTILYLGPMIGLDNASRQQVISRSDCKSPGPVKRLPYATVIACVDLCVVGSVLRSRWQGCGVPE